MIIAPIQEETLRPLHAHEASSSSKESSSKRPKKMKNIEALYDIIEPFNLFCLFIDNNPLTFMKLSKTKLETRIEED